MVRRFQMLVVHAIARISLFLNHVLKKQRYTSAQLFAIWSNVLGRGGSVALLTTYKHSAAAAVNTIPALLIVSSERDTFIVAPGLLRMYQPHRSKKMAIMKNARSNNSREFSTYVSAEFMKKPHFLLDGTTV
jgi:hypothetical protein